MFSGQTNKGLVRSFVCFSLLTLRLDAHEEVYSCISFVCNIPRLTFPFVINIFVFVTFENYFQKLVVTIIVILVVIKDNDYRE